MDNLVLRCRFSLFRIIASAAMICFLLSFSTASMESIRIPSSVKNYYSYDTEDKSIIPVKQKLAELGYLSADKANNGWINNTLKEAVKKFQKDNGLKADGKLDRKLFEVLFSKSNTTSVEEGVIQAEVNPTSLVFSKEYKTDRTEIAEKKDNGSNHAIGYIVFFSSASVIGVIIFIASFKSQRNKEYVKVHSKKFAEITKLNGKYQFYSGIPHQYRLMHSFQSKRSLDSADVHSYFVLLANNDGRLREIYNQLNYNRSAFSRYMDDYAQIGKMDDKYIGQLDFNPVKFKKIEEGICRPMKAPVRDISVNIQLGYTSPKGQKSYSKSRICNYNDLDNAYRESQRKLIRRMQAEAERAKMSASLRYDIMRRDGFRCTICGAEQSDGVKLHVDHIIPVSRGGKTVESNLRTLCDRCNLGKSDKYHEGSLN